MSWKWVEEPHPALPGAEPAGSRMRSARLHPRFGGQVLPLQVLGSGLCSGVVSSAWAICCQVAPCLAGGADGARHSNPASSRTRGSRWWLAASAYSTPESVPSVPPFPVTGSGSSGRRRRLWDRSSRAATLCAEAVTRPGPFRGSGIRSTPWARASPKSPTDTAKHAR
jgi:hypothetical protein